MGEYLLMPKLDMSMKEGTIVSWLVGKGDDIKKGEYAVEVETGKVSIEVDNTSLSGKVLEVYYEEGETVEVNTPIMFIGSADDRIPTKEESLEYFRSIKRQNSAAFDDHGYDYDVIIIGSGQAGYTFAMKASEYTDRIAIIESGTFGGVCLNRGCIPSRFFGKRSEILSKINSSGSFGLEIGDSAVDYAKMKKNKDDMVFRLRQSMKHTLSGMCDVYESGGVLLAPNIIKTQGGIISGKYIVIASGSKREEGKIASDGSVKIISTEEFFDVEDLPKRAVFMGTSPYLAEQAVMWKNFGVEVILCGSGNYTHEAYLDRKIRKDLKKSGIKLMEGDPSEIKCGGVIFSGGEEVLCEVAVYENARVANTVPSEVGFVMTEDGFYMVDEGFLTSVDGIYAIGDANGLSLTAQGAGSDAEELAGILFEGKEPMRKVYPKCLNVIPKAAYVGRSEQELERLGIPHISAKRSYSSHPAAMASGEEGYVKIVCDDTYGEILYCQVVAECADEIISVISLAMRNELTVDELAGSVFAHPTMTELIAMLCSELSEKIKVK